MLQYLYERQPQVAMAMAATLLVIYGNDINRFFRRRVKQWEFPLRVLFFVCLCAFGYGYASLMLTRFLQYIFAQLDIWTFSGATLICFIALGLLAEHKKQL